MLDRAEPLPEPGDGIRMRAAHGREPVRDGTRLAVPVDPSGEVPGLIETASEPAAVQTAQVAGRPENSPRVERPSPLVVDLFEPEGDPAIRVQKRTVDTRRPDAWGDVVEEPGPIRVEFPPAVVEQVGLGEAWSLSAFLDQRPRNAVSRDDRLSREPCHRPVGEERVVLQRLTPHIQESSDGPAERIRDC